MTEQVVTTSRVRTSGQVPGGASSGPQAPAGTTSLLRLLALALILVTLIPFLPLACLIHSNLQSEHAELEREIRASNEHIAKLAAGSVDTLLRQLHQPPQQVSGKLVWPPLELSGADWELVSDDCVITRSQVSEARQGTACEYCALLSSVGVDEPLLTGVGSWLDDAPPTVLLIRRLGPDLHSLVGVIDPSELHAEMHAWSGLGLDRHVYVVDHDGRLLFYSDLALSERGEDLRSNPPIRLFLDGGSGELLYQSIVSGKERLGVVHRLQQADWAVIVSADVASRLLPMRSRYRMLGWSIAFALIAAVGILLWLSSGVVSPVRDIAQALQRTEHLGRAPLALRASTTRVSEYRELVAAFDELGAEVAEVERELVQAEKSSLLGQLASGLAHEMGTPLNVIIGNAQYLLRKSGDDDPSHEILELIIKQARRIAGMIRRLLDLSQPARAQLVAVDPAAVVRQTLDLVPGLGGEITVETKIDSAIPAVLADPKLLEHALLNLVVNACQAMPDGGALTVGLERQEAGAGGPALVALSVHDTGCGIPENDLSRVTEPFFTTKPPGQGTGLGLAIVERIIHQHGGRLEISSRVGEGSLFTIVLRSATAEPGGPEDDGRGVP